MSQRNRFRQLASYGGFLPGLPSFPSAANSIMGQFIPNVGNNTWGYYDPGNNRWKIWAGSGETPFTIANNQVSVANVTGLLLSGASQRSAFIFYSIYRNTTSTGATELSECGILMATYKTVAATWELAPLGSVGDAGVTFTITSAGQVQYTSTSITGTAATSKMTFFVMDLGV